MNKSIGTVAFTETLENQIQWLDRTRFQGVGHASRYALSGDVHVTQRYRGGRTITLTVQPPWCRLLKATVDNLWALSALPGGIYVFTWGTDIYYVMFDHAQGPAVDLQPVTARDDEPEWAGAIHLLEVTYGD